MDEKDNIRIRRAAMLKKFSRIRKEHWITVCLAVFAGAIGAQRFYLGHYIMAFGISVLFLITAAIASDNSQPTATLILCLICAAIFVFEIFYGTKATDIKNDNIRRELETEFDL